jgi:hypothetical protein
MNPDSLYAINNSRGLGIPQLTAGIILRLPGRAHPAWSKLYWHTEKLVDRQYNIGNIKSAGVIEIHGHLPGVAAFRWTFAQKVSVRSAGFESGIAIDNVGHIDLSAAVEITNYVAAAAALDEPEAGEMLYYLRWIQFTYSIIG